MLKSCLCSTLLICFFSFSATGQSSHAAKKSLFDGLSFAGWTGDTVHTWRISEGMIVAGTPNEEPPHNEFLATKRSYKNFILHLKFKLTGHEGFVNAGVQFHSVHAANPPYEMSGYQADLGDGYWASLYDESRRNKTLQQPDSLAVEKLIRKQEWNDYEVQSENGRIRISLNGKQTVDYTEKDPAIPQSGLIALQLHGGGKTVVYYKDINIEELP